ncbi:MAG: LptF/LptG family permease [Thermoguttaceae bacterium]|jgi:lipopolysaccharide export system permease protein
MAILPRYVLVEVIKVFAVSVTALTLLVVLGFVGREATAQGLPLLPTLRLIPYSLPETLRVTVPMTLLLACTTVFSRISGANEIVAIKAMGISPMVLLWPVFIFAFMMSLTTVWLNDLADSWGTINIQRVIIEAVEEIAYSMLQSQHRYSNSTFSINVKDIDGRKLERVTLSIMGHGSSPKMTVTAEEAVLHSDRGEGVLKVFLRNSVVDVGGKFSLVWPGVHEMEIPLTDASRAHNSNVWTNLPLRSLGDAIATAQSQIEQQEQKMAAQAAYQMACGDFDEMTSDKGIEQWRQDEADKAELWSRYYRLLSVPQRRWAGGFACLCFALVGAPMAICLRNRDFLTSFFLCFLPILIVYYPLMIFGAVQVKNGNLPTIFVWAGNIMLMLWGVWLLRRVIRY